MATLKITQKKSRIGATERQCRNLDALGLHKVNQSVQHEDSPVIKGMIEKVRHLVVIETVNAEKPKKAAAPKAEAPKAEAPKAEEPKAEKKAAPKKEAAPKADKPAEQKKAPAKPKAEKKEEAAE